MFNLAKIYPQDATDEQKRRIAAGAEAAHANITARLEHLHAKHDDLLLAVAITLDEQAEALAAHGYPERIQEFGRLLVGYIAAPMVAAAVAAEDLPDTPAVLVDGDLS